ncbi:hypothetical protein V2J09_007641 [Rumex salicifolius]
MGVNGAASSLVFNRLLRDTVSTKSIPKKANAVTNTILSHLESGRLRKAVSLLFASPFPFSFSLYAHLFQLCSSSLAIVEARKVESHLITYSHPPPTFLLNRAIETFGKCGCLRDARELFDEMPLRDGGSWNAMITAYTRGGSSDEALRMFLDMTKSGVSPSEVTLASVLGSCGNVLELGLSRQIHGLVVKNGFSGNVILESSLVDIYGKCGVMRDARSVFDEMKTPNAVSWNVIVRRYLEVGDQLGALCMFFEMTRKDTRPLNFTFSNALIACSGVAALKEGVQIHGVAVKIGYESDEVVSNSLIDMYAKSGNLECASKILDQPNSKNLFALTSMVSAYATSGRIREARELFDEMPERSIITWNAMLGGYTHSSEWEEALNFAFLMCHETEAVDHVTITLILNICAGLSDIDLGKQAHGHMYRRGLFCNTIVSNALLDMYGKCGSPRTARKWFSQMNGLRSRASWNSLMSSHARNQLSEAVMTLFPVMLQETTPNEYTFATLLASCSNIFALKQGKEIHGFMIKNNYEIDDVVLGSMVDMYSKCRVLDYAIKVFKEASPGDVILWNSMISGCCHHGKCSEALEFFELMKNHNIKPDNVTFEGVLHACINGGYIELGEEYFESMSSEYFVMARTEHYERMIELYCRHGAMKELDKFIKKLPFEPTIPILGRVFDACREYGHKRLGKLTAEKLNLPVPWFFDGSDAD